MRISDWSSDVCSSDLYAPGAPRHGLRGADREGQLVELEVGKEPASGSGRDAPNAVGDVAPSIAAHQRHAGTRRQWADLDDIDPDDVPQADEELPKLRVDHGDRQEPIVLGALIIGNDAGASAERHMIAGLGAGN